MSTDSRKNDLSRRGFLTRGCGLAGLSLASALDDGGLLGGLLNGQALAAQAPAPALAGQQAGQLGPMAPRPPHFPARAKACIFLFMFGGPSQMDLFDYKPELNKRSGQTIDHERRRRQMRVSVLLGSKRHFAQHGETGQWCSDALPLVSRHMDKLAVIKSLYTDSFAHGSAVLQMNSSFALQGHPSLGSWIGYGRGSTNVDLPGYVVMHDPRGGPISGAVNWSNGYLPAAYQGALFQATGEPLLDLSAGPASRTRFAMTRAMQRSQMDALAALNQQHLAQRGETDQLTARIAAAELAYRMQSTAPEALDLSQESERTQAMYGLGLPASDERFAQSPGVFGRQCLIARRLVERGVRFVQIYHGGGHQQQTWDAHHGVEQNLAIHGPEVDRPIAALLTDLERTGLLDETLVIWGGEFGRQPVSQQAGDNQEEAPDGRDHNPKAFSMWMAGAGIRPGSYGETDELGAEAVVDRHHVRELHATVLHLMGLDYRRLTYPYGGLDRRMTGPEDVPLIREVLA